jgi:uncharacterized protein (TIGR03083 family)
MDPDGILHDARTAVEVLSAALTDLLRDLPTADTPIEGSQWSIRDAAAHLTNITMVYTEMATGAASPIAQFPSGVSRHNAQRLADNADMAPAALAKSLIVATEQFAEATTSRAPSTSIRFHGGMTLNLSQLAAALLGEYVLHGYDIALAAGAAWPIDPAHAALVLPCYIPVFSLLTDPETSHGHTAAYRLELGAAGRFTARFVDGALSIEAPDTGPVGCTITADPVAFLLVASGRLSQWTAIALGLMTTTGQHPELGLGFAARIHFP